MAPHSVSTAELSRGKPAQIILAGVLVLMAGILPAPPASAGRKPKPLMFSQETPACGMLDDRGIHIPSQWTSFTPPPVGNSYQDPSFGCQVTRLTDSMQDERLADGRHASLMNYYSTFTAVNNSDSMVFVTADNGSWRIKGIDGRMLIPADKMPAMNNGHPVWDGRRANAFYYTLGRRLVLGVTEEKSVQSHEVYEFKEYLGIVSPDAADLSQDSDHIALVGENPDHTMDIFVWSIPERKKTAIYSTACKAKSPIPQSPQPGCLHKLQLTPNNFLVIQFDQDGSEPEQGLRLWDGAKLVHLQDATNHIDTGYDLDGNPIFIGTNNSRTLSGLKSPCAHEWGIDIRQLLRLSSSFCLMERHPDAHISYRGGPSQPWIAISFFDSRDSGPERFNNEPGFQSPTKDNWQLYEDEILLARVDGKAIYRLAQARARSAVGYWSTPRAAISRDGKYVVFTSNMAHPNGCPSNTQVPNQCTDVYAIRVR